MICAGEGKAGFLGMSGPRPWLPSVERRSGRKAGLRNVGWIMLDREAVAQRLVRVAHVETQYARAALPVERLGSLITTPRLFHYRPQYALLRPSLHRQGHDGSQQRLYLRHLRLARSRHGRRVRVLLAVEAVAADPSLRIVGARNRLRARRGLHVRARPATDALRAVRFAERAAAHAASSPAGSSTVPTDLCTGSNSSRGRSAWAAQVTPRHSTPQ
jgi:hypothetical protein